MLINKHLVSLIHRNFEQKVTNRLIVLVNECDNEQIEHLLNTGFYLGENMHLTFQRGIGFNCYNSDKEIIGYKHVCRLMKEHLNESLTNG